MKSIVLTCEHAVNTVPAQYAALFAAFQHELNSHRGIDFGVLAIGEYLKESLHCEFFSATATRLLIDCNRSLTHRHCFSEITRPLSILEKEQIIQNYYSPYRESVESYIKTRIENGEQVWHLSIHSFTPVFNDIVRSTDIGLLYDPRRENEKIWAKRWQQQLRQQAPSLRIRLNYPYKGISNSFTCDLRKKYPIESYAGMELEINQTLVNDNQSLAYTAYTLSKTLKRLL